MIKIRLTSSPVIRLCLLFGSVWLAGIAYAQTDTIKVLENAKSDWQKGVLTKLELGNTLKISKIVTLNNTYTFTNCGQTGNTGPNQSQCNSAYSGTNLDGKVTVVGGIQQWVVPNNGTFILEAQGAQGYGGNGGRGARMNGKFALTNGQKLSILVGQTAAAPNLGVNQYGGGGGSFIMKAGSATPVNDEVLLVAGGGGGSWATTFDPADARITQNGGAGSGGTFGAGGTSGQGGGAGGAADGGGGLLGDGAGPTGGRAYVNSGNGGAGAGVGGFGGGGGTNSWDNKRGGGGGGYSGGGGSSIAGTSNPAGGGGGSYNGGVEQENEAGFKYGHGKVIISYKEYAGYEASGNRISPPIKVNGDMCVLGSKISWQANEPSGTSAQVLVRLSADTGATWSAWDTAINGGGLPGLDSLHRLNNVYLQTQIKLQSGDGTATPVFSLLDLWVARGKLPMSSFLQDTVGNTVWFYDQSQNLDSRIWDFGDGQTDTAQNPDHTYLNPGTYQVCLMGSNACGTDTFCKEIVVNGPMSMGLELNKTTLIYPQPAGDQVWVRGISLSAGSTLEIIDVSGRSIRFCIPLQNLTDPESWSIDLTGMDTGLYFLKAEKDGQSFLRPVLKN